MLNNMDIIFLAGLFPKEKEQEIINNSIGSIQNAANTLQWNIVNGLDKNNKKTIKIINSVYIGSYPKRYRKAFIKTYNFSHCINATDINVGFLNLFGIKHYLRYFSLKPHLKKWMNDNKKDKVIIVYALTNVFVKCIKYVKKINPSIKTCVIVPDLPQYMNTSTNASKIYEILKYVDIKTINKNLKYVDSFVLLTEQMSDKLNIDNYVVVEGIATDIFENLQQEQKNTFREDYKYILYTGTLNRKYGVLNLVEAFEKIKQPNYRLILCGVGDSLKDILQAQKRDKRIIFKGQVTRHEVLNLQTQATVVINPRQNTEEFTKYSFPSKNLEYLSSGTPLIAYKLDGIPDEYDDYIYYVEDNSIETLKRSIVEVCEKPQEELDRFGICAKNFVLKEKNNIVQSRKIIEMIGNIKI